MKTVILGAGMAGLSCAYHLKKDYSILEKEDRVGGLSRSLSIDGFVFDYTGHLLHLHNPYSTKLILKLLRGNLLKIKRNAWIHSNGVSTRYPFQANTYGLPVDVVKECLLGFVDAQCQPANALPPNPSFLDWSLAHFGEGITRHFMGPYNRKLWLEDLKNLTTEWCGSFVPKVQWEEVLQGALTDQTKEFGYNAHFYYPKRGGIEALAQAFARGLTDIRLKTFVDEVDHKRRRVNGNIAYDHLVSTLPLPVLLSRMPNLPSEIVAAKEKLRWNSVLCLNLGVERPRISDKHWIYFPESKYVFYRVGFPMNFSPHIAPRRGSSMYVEISAKPGQWPDFSDTLDRSLEGLRDSGILQKKDKILVSVWQPIPCAYVIYDRNRTPAVSLILKFLEKHNIHSIGRYGGWKYSFMEEAVLDGKKTAETIRSKR